MPTNEKKKGRDLKEAAELIHGAILASDPKLKGTHFLVERNKIMKVRGARLEIDVFVQTSPGSLYESTSILECKDWAEPVGSEAVHVLANEVKTIQATKGFLVARQITKDARALLEADPKLRFVRCSSDFAGLLNSAILSHSVRSFVRTSRRLNCGQDVPLQKPSHGPPRRYRTHVRRINC